MNVELAGNKELEQLLETGNIELADKVKLANRLNTEINEIELEVKKVLTAFEKQKTLTQKQNKDIENNEMKLEHIGISLERKLEKVKLDKKAQTNKLGFHIEISSDGSGFEMVFNNVDAVLKDREAFVKIKVTASSGGGVSKYSVESWFPNEAKGMDKLAEDLNLSGDVSRFAWLVRKSFVEAWADDQ